MPSQSGATTRPACSVNPQTRALCLLVWPVTLLIHVCRYILEHFMAGQHKPLPHFPVPLIVTRGPETVPNHDACCTAPSKQTPNRASLLLVAPSTESRGPEAVLPPTTILLSAAQRFLTQRVSASTPTLCVPSLSLAPQYLRDQKLSAMTFIPMATCKVKPLNERLRTLGGSAKMAIDLIQHDPAYQRGENAQARWLWSRPADILLATLLPSCPKPCQVSQCSHPLVLA